MFFFNFFLKGFSKFYVIIKLKLNKKLNNFNYYLFKKWKVKKKII